MTSEEAMAFAKSMEGKCAARNYLGSALRLDAMAALRLAQLDILRERRGQLDASLSAAAKRGEIDLEIAAQEEGLLEDYKQLLARQRAIAQAIRTLPDERWRLVLEMRYLQGMPFVRISMTLHYDERQTFRLHEQGLIRIALEMALENLPGGEEFLPPVPKGD